MAFISVVHAAPEVAANVTYADIGIATIIQLRRNAGCIQSGRGDRAPEIATVVIAKATGNTSDAGNTIHNVPAQNPNATKPTMPQSIGVKHLLGGSASGNARCPNANSANAQGSCSA